MKRVLLSLIMLTCAVAALPAQDQPVTVILVRHAEKEAQPADNPPLSQLGLARVDQLVAAVRHAGITTIYSTPYARTLQTAQGVAKVVNAAVVETPVPNRNVAAYGDSVAARAKRDGGVILVVGHSNTMAAVIKALGGPAIDEIADPEYDHLFVLTVQEGKPTRLLKTRYGSPSK